TAAVSPAFFTDNVLNNVPLIPQHAWDKTSDASPVGDYDTTESGATAVYAFLQKEGGQISTFTTNPLWKGGDGPWTVPDLNSDGTQYGYVPNKSSSGTTKPYLDHWENKAYTTDTAMIDEMRAGGTISAGGLPLNDYKQLGQLKSVGYSDVPL